MELNGGVFSGPGWTLIQKNIAAAQIIAIGEDHLTREVPKFVTALCDAMGPNTLTAMAIETGPEVAGFLQTRVTSEQHDQDMAALTRRYPDSVAFFNIAEENDLLTHCATASGRGGFEIWGLDQEFFGAGGWLLDSIMEEPLSPDARAAIQDLRSEERRDALRARASGDPSDLFLISVPDATLEAARKILFQGSGERSQRLFAAIMTTHRIYKENAEGSPLANPDRAVLLKKELAAHLDAWRASGKGGKLLVKFGEWHLYRGYNPLGQRDLGNFIAEYADVNGVPSLHIAVLGSRGLHAFYGGYAKPLKREPFVMSDDPRYRWLQPAIDVAQPSAWTVFDLRRLKEARVKALPEGWRQLSDGYDLLVLAPEISPSHTVDDPRP